MLEPALVSALASDDQQTRMHAAVKYARASARCDAAMLMSHRRDREGFSILANDGYSDAVADFFSTSIEHMPEFASALRKTELISWDNKPEFVNSYSAQAILIPAGFKNGMTISSRDASGKLIGVLVVNRSAPAFPSSHKEPIGQLGPLFHDFLARSREKEIKRLTRREFDVLQLVGGGYSNAEIAVRLEVAPRTIATHLENIFVRFNVHNRVQAIVEAQRLGLLD